MPAAKGGGTGTAKAQFRSGNKVEAMSSVPGFVGIWFEAEFLGNGQRRGSVKVRYKHLVKNDDGSSRFLEDSLDVNCLRTGGTRLAKPEKLRPAGERGGGFCEGRMVGRPHHGRMFTLSIWINGTWVALFDSLVTDEKAPNLLAATTKATESTFKTMRKREKPFGSSGRSKENLSSQIIGM